MSLQQLLLLSVLLGVVSVSTERRAVCRGDVSRRAAQMRVFVAVDLVVGVDVVHSSVRSRQGIGASVVFVFVENFFEIFFVLVVAE